MTFIVLFLVCGISYVIWKTFRLQLIEALRWVRYGELWLGQLMHGKDANVFDPDTGEQLISTWKNWWRHTDVREVTNEHIRVSTLVAVQPIRYVFIALMGVMSLIVIFKGPNTHFRRRMGLEELMKEQAKSFPAITPFLKFDPRQQPFRAPGSPVPAQLPLFAEALSPEEWLAYHEVTYSGGQLDANRAWQALSKQLGNRWQGPLKLPLHAQGIYAACCLKAARKRKDSEALLNALSLSWTADGGFKISSGLKSDIRKIIKDPKLGGAMQRFVDHHAYETTAMLCALQRARQEGGVMAPAEFAWLRGHDRTLWYPLNNLGRKSYHAEAAGAMVHFTNELIAGQKIPTPRFEEVIRGIEQYMKSGSARAIPELDKKAGGAKYFKTKKKK